MVTAYLGSSDRSHEAESAPNVATSANCLLNGVYLPFKHYKKVSLWKEEGLFCWMDAYFPCQMPSYPSLIFSEYLLTVVSFLKFAH